MTIIPIFSVTYRNQHNHIHVEVFDREEEALARHNEIADSGARVKFQYHTIRVGYGA